MLQLPACTHRWHRFCDHGPVHGVATRRQTRASKPSGEPKRSHTMASTEVVCQCGEHNTTTHTQRLSQGLLSGERTQARTSTLESSPMASSAVVSVGTHWLNMTSEVAPLGGTLMKGK